MPKLWDYIRGWTEDRYCSKCGAEMRIEVETMTAEPQTGAPILAVMTKFCPICPDPWLWSRVVDIERYRNNE